MEALLYGLLPHKMAAVNMAKDEHKKVILLYCISETTSISGKSTTLRLLSYLEN